MYIKSDAVWGAILPRLHDHVAQGGSLEEIAEFTDSQPETVQRWISGGRINGDRLVKLWHFLHCVGFRSPEITKLDAYNVYVGELYAFGILTADDLCQVLNVRNKNAVFDIMRGRKPANPTYLLDNLKEMHGEELQVRKDRLVKRGAESSADELTSVPMNGVAPASVSAATVSNEIPDVDLALRVAGELQQSVVFLRFLSSDTCSEATRALVLGLTNGLDDLSEGVDVLRQGQLS